jgi:hypothetical protein
MKNIFPLEKTFNILGGIATLSIIESSKILSEASLYGAGTTRYTSSVSVTFEKDNEKITIAEFFNQEKQNVLDIEAYIEECSSVLEFNVKINSALEKFVENCICDVLFGENL